MVHAPPPSSRWLSASKQKLKQASMHASIHRSSPPPPPPQEQQELQELQHPSVVQPPPPPPPPPPTKYSRSPSTPRSRQVALANLKLDSSLSSSSIGLIPGFSTNSSRSDFSSKYFFGQDPRLSIASPAHSPLLRRLPPPRITSITSAPPKFKSRRKLGFQGNAILFMLCLLLFFFLLDWWVLSGLWSTPLPDANNESFQLPLSSQVMVIYILQ